MFDPKQYNVSRLRIDLFTVERLFEALTTVNIHCILNRDTHDRVVTYRMYRPLRRSKSK